MTLVEPPPPNPLLGAVLCECGGPHDFRDHPETTAASDPSAPEANNAEG
jgi:hypothetical protein